MKRINMAVIFLAFSMAAWAQKQTPANGGKDKLEYQGYTIKLVPAAGGTFGYYIRKGSELVVQQFRNPFTASPAGFAKKEDAFKTAQWQIDHLGQEKPLNTGAPQPKAKAGNPGADKLPPALARKLPVQGNRAPVTNQRLSPKVAEELQITVQH